MLFGRLSMNHGIHQFGCSNASKWQHCLKFWRFPQCRSLPQTLLHPEQQQMAALEQLHHLQTALAGSDAGLPDLEELLLPDIDTLLDNRTDEQPGSACHPVLDTDTARIRYSELPQASQWPGSFERGDSAGSSLTSVVRGISTAQVSPVNESCTCSASQTALGQLHSSA